MDRALILQCRTIGCHWPLHFRTPHEHTPTSTSYAVHGPVAVVTLKRPPVNVLGNALRSSSGQGAAGLFEVC